MPIMETDNKELIVTNIVKEQLSLYAAAKNLSQNVARLHLIAHLGISGKLLSHWENNTNQPSLAEAFKIAQFFGKPIEKIFITINP